MYNPLVRDYIWWMHQLTELSLFVFLKKFPTQFLAISLLPGLRQQLSALAQLKHTCSSLDEPSSVCRLTRTLRGCSTEMLWLYTSFSEYSERKEHHTEWTCVLTKKCLFSCHLDVDIGQEHKAHPICTRSIQLYHLAFHHEEHNQDEQSQNSLCRAPLLEIHEKELIQRGGTWGYAGYPTHVFSFWAAG